jgi:hypothetical protein
VQNTSAQAFRKILLPFDAGTFESMSSPTVTGEMSITLDAIGEASPGRVCQSARDQGGRYNAQRRLPSASGKVKTMTG